MSLLGWQTAKDAEPPKERSIQRNSGQLLGRLDELLPFLYIAQYGATLRDLRTRWSSAAPGLFAVGEATGGHRPGVAPRVGLILPLRMCSDEATARALLDVSVLIDNPSGTKLAERRRDVETRLDRTFGGNLCLPEREGLDGFCALQPSPGFFRQLCDTFDYVTDVEDNPAGTVRVTGSSRFGWRSYGELMEWYHVKRLQNPFGHWSPLVPFLVAGNTASISSHSTQRWGRIGLHRPSDEPSRWFAIRPDVRDAQFGVRLEMDKFGWAYLYLSLNDASLTIALSDVYDPFDTLVAWSREVAEGDIPVEMEIDEEGQVAVLTVLKLDDAQRVLLRVTRKHEDEILLEGIVARSLIGAALRAELRRFFATEFDPEHWDGRDDHEQPDEDNNDEGYSPPISVNARDRVLNDPWIAGGD